MGNPIKGALWFGLGSNRTNVRFPN